MTRQHPNAQTCGPSATAAQLVALGTAIARRLPGAWTITHLRLHDRETCTDLVDRLWDQAVAHWALLDFVQSDGGCLLTGPNEQQLLLLPRPLAQRRRAPYLVSGLVPGWAVESAKGHDVANAITVPADPVKAAALTARRLPSAPSVPDSPRRPLRRRMDTDAPVRAPAPKPRPSAASQEMEAVSTMAGGRVAESGTPSAESSLTCADSPTNAPAGRH